MPDELIVKEVNKSYQGATKHLVVNQISFSCISGQVVSIIGPSGCGKSTLLKILGNVLEADSGEVIFNGEDISRLRKQFGIGWIPQFPTLLKNRTVAGNISLPSEIIGIKPDVEKMLRLVDLEDCKKKYPGELSGGMKQRAAFAQVMSYSPRLLLLDEPFSSLDEINREKMQHEFLSLISKRRPITIFVTHSIEEAVLISNKVIIMDKLGRLSGSWDIAYGSDRSLFVDSDYFTKTVRGLRAELAGLI